MQDWDAPGFHLLLNLGRLISYSLVGLMIGALGSVLVASGQMAGLGSPLRRGVALVTGPLLIWFGLAQINPNHVPKVPFLNPMAQASWHDRLSRAMQALSLNPQQWTPLLLGLAWGLMPCGFLYAAQLEAAETTNLWRGGATMLAFGVGTLPMMLGVGVSTAWVSGDRRGQLFRLGGWITLLIGLMTLLRDNDMVDFTGHGALVCLLLALVACPLSRLWSPLLVYRRALGVGAFVLSVAHGAHMLTMGWNLAALPFLVPSLQAGGWAGIVALGLMTPLALRSFNGAQTRLGHYWRRLHLLSIPVFVLAVAHALLLGSSYLGSFERSTQQWLGAVVLVSVALLALLVRWRGLWSLLSLEKYYAPANLSLMSVLLLGSLVVLPAQAHKTEVSGDVAGTWHLEPNHSPRAGEPARVWVALTQQGGQVIPLEQCDCALAVYVNPPAGGGSGHAAYPTGDIP